MDGQEQGWTPAIGELVWAKVRSHPWWPARVFDPSQASQRARLSGRSNHLLIAFFGDETFNWMKSNDLLPFASNYASKERQTSQKLFCTALSEALEYLDEHLERGVEVAPGIEQEQVNTEVSAGDLLKYVRQLAVSPLEWGPDVVQSSKLRQRLRTLRTSYATAAGIAELGSLRPKEVSLEEEKEGEGIEGGGTPKGKPAESKAGAKKRKPKEKEEKEEKKVEAEGKKKRKPSEEGKPRKPRQKKEVAQEEAVDVKDLKRQAVEEEEEEDEGDRTAGAKQGAESVYEWTDDGFDQEAQPITSTYKRKRASEGSGDDSQKSGKKKKFHNGWGGEGGLQGGEGEEVEEEEIEAGEEVEGERKEDEGFGDGETMMELGKGDAGQVQDELGLTVGEQSEKLVSENLGMQDTKAEKDFAEGQKEKDQIKGVKRGLSEGDAGLQDSEMKEVREAKPKKAKSENRVGRTNVGEPESEKPSKQSKSVELKGKVLVMKRKKNGELALGGAGKPGVSSRITAEPSKQGIPKKQMQHDPKTLGTKKKGKVKESAANNQMEKGDVERPLHKAKEMTQEKLKRRKKDGDGGVVRKKGMRPSEVVGGKAELRTKSLLDPGRAFSSRGEEGNGGKTMAEKGEKGLLAGRGEESDLEGRAAKKIEDSSEQGEAKPAGEERTGQDEVVANAEAMEEGGGAVDGGERVAMAEPLGPPTEEERQQLKDTLDHLRRLAKVPTSWDSEDEAVLSMRARLLELRKWVYAKGNWAAAGVTPAVAATAAMADSDETSLDKSAATEVVHAPPLVEEGAPHEKTGGDSDRHRDGVKGKDGRGKGKDGGHRDAERDADRRRREQAREEKERMKEREREGRTGQQAHKNGELKGKQDHQGVGKEGERRKGMVTPSEKKRSAESGAMRRHGEYEDAMRRPLKGGHRMIDGLDDVCMDRLRPTNLAGSPSGRNKGSEGRGREEDRPGFGKGPARSGSYQPMGRSPGSEEDLRLLQIKFVPKVSIPSETRLRMDFTSYGVIESVRVNPATRFGLVLFKSQRQAEEALSHMKQGKVLGPNLVEKAQLRVPLSAPGEDGRAGQRDRERNRGGEKARERDEDRGRDYLSSAQTRGKADQRETPPPSRAKAADQASISWPSERAEDKSRIGPGTTAAVSMHSRAASWGLPPPPSPSAPSQTRAYEPQPAVVPPNLPPGMGGSGELGHSQPASWQGPHGPQAVPSGSGQPQPALTSLPGVDANAAAGAASGFFKPPLQVETLATTAPGAPMPTPAFQPPLPLGPPPLPAGTPGGPAGAAFGGTTMPADGAVGVRPSGALGGLGEGPLAGFLAAMAAPPPSAAPAGPDIGGQLMQLLHQVNSLVVPGQGGKGPQ